MDSSNLTLWTGPFSIKGVSDLFLSEACFLYVPILNANTVDSDQTPQSAASDMGLHSLPMFILWDARHKWVNVGTETQTDTIQIDVYFEYIQILQSDCMIGF